MTPPKKPDWIEIADTDGDAGDDDDDDDDH